jgi:Carboxypeptidase regulatory-like domain
VIADGGFENGGIPSSIWNSPQTSTNFGTPLCDAGSCGTGGGTAPPRTGLIWVWFGGIPAAETATLGQNVTIPSGGPALLSFWMRIGTVTAPFTDVLNVRIDGTIVQSYPEPAVAEAAYTKRIIDLSAYANGAVHNVEFEYVGPSNGTGSYVVDDVSLIAGCPSPTPTTTPTATATSTPTATAISTATATSTPTATATSTPTATATATVAPTPIPTPAPTVSISGTVSYCPSSNPVPGVTMTVTGTSSDSTTTDGAGFYTFTGLPSGGSYTVTPTKAALAPGSAGITTVDVIVVQRHFLNLGTPLSGCPLTAADVNGDTLVSTADVIAIQRFVLNLSTGIANTGQYQFSPVSRTYPGIVTDQTDQNYDTLVFGDVASPFAD